MFLRGFVNYASQSRSYSGLQTGELRCERLDRSYQLIAANIAHNMTVHVLLEIVAAFAIVIWGAVAWTHHCNRMKKSNATWLLDCRGPTGGTSTAASADK